MIGLLAFALWTGGLAMGGAGFVCLMKGDIPGAIAWGIFAIASFQGTSAASKIGEIMGNTP